MKYTRLHKVVEVMLEMAKPLMNKDLARSETLKTEEKFNKESDKASDSKENYLHSVQVSND